VASYPPFPSCVITSPHPPRITSQSICHVVIDLARLIVAFAPQSLHATGLGDRFMGALLRASDWDEHWTPPMTKPKERNILLLLRTIVNALQKDAKFENIGWALKVPIFSFDRRKRGGILSDTHLPRKQIFAEPLPNELFTSPQRILGSTLLLKYVGLTRLPRAVG
jgi:hypothetical protein